MTYEGAIHDRELADALLEVGRDKRTGILTVQGEEEIISSLAKDQPVGEVDRQADAADQPNTKGPGTKAPRDPIAEMLDQR